MTDTEQKTIIVFAGANGAGKTTAARFLLPRHRIRQFVNADEIARGLSPFAPETQQMEAGRLVLRRIQDLIGAGDSFAYETTLSGKSQLVWLKKAREIGYRIVLYYICTQNAGINVDRVAHRVRQGGHHVPDEDVRRRYNRSLENFFQNYQTICYIIEVYDNSLERLSLIARKTISDTEYEIANPVLWERLTKEGSARDT